MDGEVPRIVKKSGPRENHVLEALENELVLKNIVEIFTPKERLMIRLVNTHFNAAVMEVMALTGTPAVRTFTQNSQINAFLKRMQNPNRPVQSLPFSSFGIALSTISLPTISKFSLAVGPRVVNLTLRSKYEPTEKDYNPAWKTNEIQQFQIMEKLSALLSNVPNLRGLTMKFNNFILEDAQTALLPLTFRTLRNIFVGDLGHFEVVSAGKYLPTLIGTILERSPSVDFFSVCLAMPDFKSPRFALYELGRAMIQLVPMLFPDSDHPRPPPFLALSLELTILDVIALRDLVNEGFNKLRHLNLHLTNFHHVDEPFKELPVGAMIPVVTAFNQFMALQGESLETLRLSFNSTPNWDLQIQIILPSLTKLKKLRIHCYKYVNRDVKKLRPIRPFMTGQFPSLTDLELLTNRCDTGLINACHFPSVKTLRFTFLGGPPTPLPYAAIFPNLTLLQFGVTPPLATVEHILTEMPDLETLDLGEGFPGFGKGEALWKLYTGGVKPFAKNKFGQFLAQGAASGTTGDSGGGGGDAGRSKGFANLKKLKWLALSLGSPLEFYAILFVMATGNFPSLEELWFRRAKEHRNQEPEIVTYFGGLGTGQVGLPGMKIEADVQAFLDGVQNLLQHA